MLKPYQAIEKSAYWILIDTRTGQPASYPTTRAQAKREERLMNDAYADAVRQELA